MGLYRALPVVSVVLLVVTQAANAEEQEQPEPPHSTVQDVIASIGRPADAIAALKMLPSELSSADVVELQNLDRTLDDSSAASSQLLRRELLIVLAKTGSVQGLGYVHRVFETAPSRRHDAARALADFAIQSRRRSSDWRLLVRSIPLLEADDITVVLDALQRFPHRGTKPHWQREVILAGLRGDDLAKAKAVHLLRHWAAMRLADEEATAAHLSAWQSWFDGKHPELPPPVLPVDNPVAKYTFADVLTMIQSATDQNGEPIRGAKVFEKAQCINCHRFGRRGEAMGPDLTNTRQWLPTKQLVEATVFPSQSITDQYETTTIITKQGQVFSGVLAAEGDKIVVLQADGKKAKVNRSDIDETVPSRKSAMPDGLLEPLSKQEIIDLFAYLQRGEP